MPQIFHPSTNTISRASIVIGGILAAGLALGLYLLFHSPFENRVGVRVDQPVPFSHEHHVSGLGIQCLYCHTTVDKSSFADIPPIHTCMTCHSQIWTNAAVLQPIRDAYQSGKPIAWNRVNQLADYVYFDHSIHVNKGVGCETCHGRVDKMPLVAKAQTLYMSWCLNCHNHPEQYVRPLANIYDMGYVPKESQATLGPKLVKEYNIAPPRLLTSCSTCHR